MTDFRWLIEAPGQRYLAVQRLNHGRYFEWTTDHDKALAFRSEEQADDLMMAVRHLAWLSNVVLFGFETTLGNAKAIEHGWMSGANKADAPVEGSK